MKKFVFLFAMTVWAAVSSLVAAESAAKAIVVKVTGEATAQIPGQPSPVKVTAGLELSAGTVIVTGAGAEVYVQPFSGTITTIKPNTTVSIDELSETKSGGVVTRQKTSLSLKSGNLISTIDPAKKEITSYGVRTPKGVAAARGTAYAVSVTDGNTTIATTADSVTFTTASGATYTIQAGMVSVTPAGGEPQPAVSLASLAASDPAVAAVIGDAVQAFATVVQENLGGLSADAVTNLAAQLAAVASAALPDQAAAFTSTIAGAVASPNSPTGGNADSAAIAVAAVTAAAAQAAPGQAPAIAAAVAVAAPQQAGAATAAATQVVPSAATAIVQAVADATNRSTADVEAAANQASAQASAGVTAAESATQNVATPGSGTDTGSTDTQQGETTDQQPEVESPVSRST